MPDAPVPIRKVDHVGIAVPSIAEALPLWAEALGGRFISGGDNEVTGLRIVHLRVADFKVELLAPLRADSMIGRHLERRGPGFHHMTFFVDDLPKTVHDLSGAGFEMTGTDLSSPVWSESFMSPRSASDAASVRGDQRRLGHRVDRVHPGRRARRAGGVAGPRPVPAGSGV